MEGADAYILLYFGRTDLLLRADFGADLLKSPSRVRRLIAQDICRPQFASCVDEAKRRRDRCLVYCRSHPEPECASDCAVDFVWNYARCRDKYCSSDDGSKSR